MNTGVRISQNNSCQICARFDLQIIMRNMPSAQSPHRHTRIPPADGNTVQGEGKHTSPQGTPGGQKKKTNKKKKKNAAAGFKSPPEHPPHAYSQLEKDTSEREPLTPIIMLWSKL